MSTESIYEKGDSLEALAVKAKQWFINNNVVVPSGAAEWQKCSVRKGEIPPGTGVTSLRRYGFNVTTFIGAITSNPSKKANNYNPLNKEKLSEIGFTLINETWKNKHKYITVKCNNCNREEEITYKLLLKYLDSSLIIRQKKYNELFNTGTKHTADFYIPKLDLVLEVTSKYNKIGKKYKETAEWKKSLSDKVVWAYSLSEVEDIVRSRMKILEQTVTNWRNVFCGSVK